MTTPTPALLPQRLLWVGTSIVLALSARLSAGTVDRRPTLNVIVDDRSSAGATELATARTRAGYLFSDASIRIAWITQGQARGVMNIGRDYVRLVVVDGATADEVIAGHDPVLGFAIPSANRAYVYYDRVQRLARDRKSTTGLVPRGRNRT